MKRYVMELYIEADTLSAACNLLSEAVDEIRSARWTGALCELNFDWSDGYSRGELVDTENEVNRE